MALKKYEKLKKIKAASYDLTDVYRCSECNAAVNLEDSRCLICERDFSDEIIVEEPVVEKANDKNDNDTFLIIKCPQCSGHLSDLAIVNRFCPNCEYVLTDSEINSEYYQKLEPYIARSFVIQYDSDKGSTKKHDMYFFDEKGEKVIEV